MVPGTTLSRAQTSRVTAIDHQGYHGRRGDTDQHALLCAPPQRPGSAQRDRHVADGSGSSTSYTRLTIRPGRNQDLFTLTRVPLQ